MAEKSPMTSKMKNVVSYYDCSDDDDNYYYSDSENEVDISLDKLNLGAKKKLLVLPLGGFLVHRVHVRNEASVRGYKPDYVHGKFLIFKRPFSSDFLKFCFERFEVGIWSSAREHNVDAALSALFGPMIRKFAFIWDQEHCTDSGFSSLENENKPIFLKELRKIWENVHRGVSWRKGQYSSSNTLLICEPTKALLNPPNTFISLSDYKVGNGDDSFLGSKGELRAFLDKLVDAEDVPTFVKGHPFGQPAITTQHPDWDYYSKIVDKFSQD
ncbi:hypothetical protein Leryth_015864 [Lithospermum erythrorhizon]|nr:hypothetical protein Leryth_015864 [Lithospermum erythrorhizon]